eukprot:jgi/Psemu1/303492/fgenesh1_kg.108_\
MGYRYSCYDDDSSNNDQYISEEEELADISIIRRRVSSEFPPRRRISGIGAGINTTEIDHWKTRCLGMQDMFDNSQARLREAEEDQRQLRQRIRELEEQLLLQSSSRKKGSLIGKEEDEVKNVQEAVKTGDWEDDNNIEGQNNRVALNHLGGNDALLKEDINRKNRKERHLPALVVEIKENHQAVSSCFYLTDGEGLNESYDQDMEEEDIAMDVHNSDGMLDDIDDDRNDINFNQRRG